MTISHEAWKSKLVEAINPWRKSGVDRWWALRVDIIITFHAAAESHFCSVRPFFNIIAIGGRTCPEFDTIPSDGAKLYRVSRSDMVAIFRGRRCCLGSESEKGREDDGGGPHFGILIREIISQWRYIEPSLSRDVFSDVVLKVFSILFFNRKNGWAFWEGYLFFISHNHRRRLCGQNIWRRAPSLPRGFSFGIYEMLSVLNHADWPRWWASRVSHQDREHSVERMSLNPQIKHPCHFVLRQVS